MLIARVSQSGDDDCCRDPIAERFHLFPFQCLSLIETIRFPFDTILSITAGVSYNLGCVG
jgi:hypothetical protein